MTNDIGNNTQGALGAGLTPHAALTAAAALPLSVDPASANDAVAMLIARAADKNAAYMRGDMERWLKLVRLAPDFTLMEPFGGPASHGFDTSAERMAQRARYFQNGKTAIELAQSYATQDMIVLVMIERQTGEVGGLPEQDWSLRVTEVYRKEGAEWVLAHRHADLLVRPISLKQAARMARGLQEAG
jgi:ketosteroid isomerase-like protein